MKKFCFIVVLTLVSTGVFSQTYQFESEGKPVIVPDSIKTPEVSDAINIEAYKLQGVPVTISIGKDYYKGFSYVITNHNAEVIFNKNTGKNEYHLLSPTNHSKRFAWFEMIVFFALFGVIAYLFCFPANSYNSPWLMVGIVFLVSFLLFAMVAPYNALPFFLMILTLVAFSVAACFYRHEIVSKAVFIGIVLLGMSVAWYVATPLFLVATVVGMLIGGIVYLLKNQFG